MVEFKTRFDEKVADVLNKRHLSKMKTLFTIVLVVFAFLGVMMLFVAYEEFQEKNESAISDLIFGIVLLVIGLCYYPLTKWFAKKYQNKINSTMSLLSKETEEIYKAVSEGKNSYTLKYAVNVNRKGFTMQITEK